MASGGSETYMSDETFDHVCTSCAKANSAQEAVKYCVQCNEYCCVFCVNIHKRFSELKCHSLLDIEPGSQRVSQTSDALILPTEQCKEHEGQSIDIYCGDHDAVCCSVCIKTDHKNCTNIHSIPDDIELISSKCDFEKPRSGINNLTRILQANVHKFNDICLKNLDDANHNASLAISDQRKKSNAILKQLEENSRRDVETLYNKLKFKLLSAKEKNESFLNKFIDLEGKFKEAKNNKSQKFVCAKLTDSIIRSAREEMRSIEEEIDTFSGGVLLSFYADHTLNELLQRFQNLGRVRGDTRKEPYKVKESRDIDVKIKSDLRSCNIWGSCLLNDETLLIVDRDNRKLKRVSVTQLSVEDYVDLPYDVCGVCRVTNDEVAVSCYTDQIIQFVSVGRIMMQSRQIKLNHICFHVAYMDNRLYVSDDTGASVYVYDLQGTLLQNISKDLNGKKLFTQTVQIAVCDREDVMFVSDFAGSLFFLDKKGNHITTVSDPNMKGADGVCIDDRGNVFVIGRYTSRIVQLGYDGKMRAVFLKAEDGVETPMSICFHRQLRKMFVTMRSKDKMKMFDLE